jgi:hypothetical protein
VNQEVADRAAAEPQSRTTAAFNADTAPPTMIRGGGSSEMRFGSEVLFTNPPG